jgi:DNA-binding CsgD family transcriptional regulator
MTARDRKDVIEVLSRFRGNLPEEARSYVLLTPRQREILMLVVEDCTEKEIACRLFITQKTVSAHKDALYRRTGARNAVALVHYALRLGLIESPHAPRVPEGAQSANAREA